ncbi:MAG: patatin-like phospholipase family protein [Thermaerobacterales bacterium]
MNHGQADNADRSPPDRIGVALSGGGFRAAFFHLGVLAQMARQGLLRHVEVISTVSGGSIVGALYYVHLKNLLESKEDGEIADGDYEAIVYRMHREFRHGVERNLRTRTFGHLLKNIRMSRPDYSRSDRIGELYDEYFYRPAFDADRTGPVEMRELKIHPPGEPDDFHPSIHNHDRAAKVPILLINATTLNTGHHWRFEASRMGAPLRSSDLLRQIDKNTRLRQPPDYESIPEHQQNLELGLAVAASAAVPGLFHPLALSGLYPDARVELVDGGVHDNQGIQALLDSGCTRFIISDAAGQLGFQANPPSSILSVLLRTNMILTARVREEQLVRLMERPDRPVAFMHLRRGLEAPEISWIGRDGRPAGAPPEAPAAGSGSDAFGVAPEVQDRLSRVRTDLDAFSEVEAWSLMLNGYRMSEWELGRVPFFARLAEESEQRPEADWEFLAVEPFMKRPTRQYLAHLDAAARSVMRVFQLNPRLQPVGRALQLGLIGGTAALIVSSWVAGDDLVRTTGLVGLTVLGLALLQQTIESWGHRLPWGIRSAVQTITRFITRGLPRALVTPVVWFHLLLLNPLFLRAGRLERLVPPEDGAEGGS